MPKETKTQKAVKTLNQYITEIDAISSQPQGHLWKMKVLNSVVNYIGQEAILTHTLNNFYFTKALKRPVRESFHTGEIIYENYHEYDPAQKPKAVELVKNIIQHIENNGVNEVISNNNNFLSALTNAQFLSGIAGYTVLFGGLIYTLGTQKIDRDYENLKDEHRDLQRDFKKLRADSLDLSKKNVNAEIQIKNLNDTIIKLKHK